MSSTDRRTLLKGLALAGGATAAGVAPAAAYEKKVAPPAAMGMLYDTTLCIGCKACVFACQQANDLEPETDAGGLHLAPTDLSGRTKNVIKLYDDGARRSYVKAQCMHCVDPACAAACMLAALEKDPTTGVVGWNSALCVGCRYCQMSCPFNVPKFEFDKALPKLVKCELCRHRVQGAALEKGADGFTRYPRGHGPACCESCPRGAVVYGTREELLAEARRRIAENPGRYFEDRVYGESEAGGTQVLYLSHLPFSKIGLPDYPGRSVPTVAYTVQESIYKGFIAPVALYGVLAAVMLRNRRKQGAEEERS
jgi:Fe-S-cluster-containing dehydrogenase component